MKHHLVAIVLAVAAAAVPAWSAPEGIGPQLASRASHLEIDTLFAPWDKKDSPGCALGVFRDGVIA